DRSSKDLTNHRNLLLLCTSNLTILPPSGSFGVTKKAMAGRLGVGDRPFLCPNLSTQQELDPARPDPPSWPLHAENFRHQCRRDPCPSLTGRPAPRAAKDRGPGRVRDSRPPRDP